MRPQKEQDFKSWVTLKLRRKKVGFGALGTFLSEGLIDKNIPGPTGLTAEAPVAVNLNLERRVRSSRLLSNIELQVPDEGVSVGENTWTYLSAHESVHRRDIHSFSETHPVYTFPPTIYSLVTPRALICRGPTIGHSSVTKDSVGGRHPTVKKSTNATIQS